MDDRLRSAFSTARLEAFADGVFAIAITLLILEVRLPDSVFPSQKGLFDALASIWPSYLGYAVSFITVGIMWVNHHTLVRLVDRVDHSFLVLNLLLLLCVAFVPFPTRVLAEHLTTQGTGVAAAAFFSGVFTFTAVIYNLLWRYASGDRRLLRPTVSERVVKSITGRYRFGPIMYLLATVLAFVSVPLSLAIVIGLDVLFLLPYRFPWGE